MSVALFTNNPQMQVILEQAWMTFADFDLQVMQAVLIKAESSKQFCVFFDADALPVITAARDLIHRGWELLNHPLYGNFKPYQQPYRSLLLRTSQSMPSGNQAYIQPHLASLSFIEEALLVYGSNPILSPKTAPAALTTDYSVLDCELMRLSLEQIGFIPTCSSFLNGKVSPSSSINSSCA